MKAIARLAFLAATAAALLLVPASQAAAAPVPGDPCPNGDIRQAQGVAHLPACLALEQVSPSRKDNQPARIRFVAGAFGTVTVGAVSADGDRVRFKSTGALGDTTGLLDVFGDWYVAERSPGNGIWSVFHTNPPPGLTKGGDAFAGAPSARFFTPDLTAWFQGAISREEYELGFHQLHRGALGSTMLFSPLLAPLSGTPGGPEGNVFLQPSGSSADGSHYYFTTRTEPVAITYLPGDPTPAGSGSVPNTWIAQLDESGDPFLELLARDGAGKAWGANCGAQLGGGHGFSGIQRDRGAISADGTRTYFTTRPSQPASGNCDAAANKLRILERLEAPGGPQIQELIASECDRVADPGPPEVLACGKTMTGPTPPAGGNAVPDGDDIYEGASIEGSRVYFTTSRQLADSDVNGLEGLGLSGCVGFFGIGIGGCDLYLYDAAKPAGERLTQITAGSTGQTAPEVEVISGDGSHIYFTSTEVLTGTPGPGGGTAQPGQPNLYAYDAVQDELAFVATTNPGNPYPVPVLGPDPTEIGVGGDGRLLFFTASAALTADDLDGSKVDVFRYDADQHTLARISKAAPGGSDNEPYDVFISPAEGFGLGGPTDPNSPDFVVRGRWVSEDGSVVTFKTQDALTPGDDNGLLDSHVYRDGRPWRLPGTADPTNGLVHTDGLNDGPQLSPEGDTVAFQSFQRLLPRDNDGAVDTYALRVEGGFPEPPDPVICPADSNGGCQGPAGGPIGPESGASATLLGTGNLKPKKAKPRRCPKGKRKVRRRGKVRCVKRKGAKRKARQQRRNRHANADRRAGK